MARSHTTLQTTALPSTRSPARSEKTVVLYGSDWPNSDPLGSYSQVIGIVREYFSDKEATAREKYFRLNSKSAYRWLDRG